MPNILVPTTPRGTVKQIVGSFNNGVFKRGDSKNSKEQKALEEISDLQRAKELLQMYKDSTDSDDEDDSSFIGAGKRWQQTSRPIDDDDEVDDRGYCKHLSGFHEEEEELEEDLEDEAAPPPPNSLQKQTSLSAPITTWSRSNSSVIGVGESVIPPPGKSLEIEPFGSLCIPFETVYNMGNVINSGFYGEVYKAHHNLLTYKAQVAVKVVDKYAVHNDRQVIEEAKILKDLRTLPNIVQIFDFYVDNEFIYMVQELAAGGDVFDRLLEKQKYTENDARDLAILLLTTVEMLHERKLVHRDLKPENLLLKNKKSDSNILLCDFGFAKYLPPDGTTGLFTQCGTPLFTAPEVVTGVEYWEKVDMWSVGCILFMLLCGVQPFEERSDSELVQSIATADYNFNHPAWDTVSNDATSLISSLLILNKDKRLSGQKALEHEWFRTPSNHLKTNFLTKTLKGIKNYCENIRPPNIVHIDEQYTGEEDLKYIEPEEIIPVKRKNNIPKPGHSLNQEPVNGKLSSMCFDDIYQCYKMVNSSASGTLFEAYHSTEKIPSQVVVKVIDRIITGEGSKNNDAAYSNRLNEAKVLKDLREVPTIATLWDFYADKSKIYMVYEFNSCEDVFSRMLHDRKLYSECEAKKLMLNLLQAIESLHRIKLVHRNLKPQKLILKSFLNDTDILLSGFDYSKYLPADGKTGLTTQCGTLSFIAPEVINGSKYFEEVDMWSVGCTLYMILSGNMPFEGSNDVELHEAIITGKLNFDNDRIWGGKSTELKDLISNLLNVDREKRLSVYQALEHEWFPENSTLFLKSKSNENGSESPPPNKEDEAFIPYIGESLEVEPIGSLNVPFDKVYQLGAKIAIGSFGAIYIVKHVSIENGANSSLADDNVDTIDADANVDDEKVTTTAVKIIDRKNIAYAEATIHEASILKGIRDLPLVVRILDFYMDDDNIYMVCNNTPVGAVYNRLCQIKKYKESDARELCKILLIVTNSIHEKKLIHRNIKPETLILKSFRSDSDILLSGFGSSKYLPNASYNEDNNDYENKNESQPKERRRGDGLTTICGSPDFRAPEMLIGQKYYEEVDMWSIGCVIYMLLCGNNPFHGNNEVEILQKIANADFAFDDDIANGGSQVWGIISEDAKSFISKLLVVDIEERLTAKEALEDTWFAEKIIPLVGESLTVDPLGHTNTPFSDVYEIAGLIAKTEFSDIHIANHPSNRDDVSVKIIDRKINAEYAELIIHEATILKDMHDTPHIVKLCDFYMDEKRIYAVFNYVPFGDVTHRLQQIKKYEESEARELLKVALKGIQGVHEHKLVHRDLKPENLIFKSTVNHTDIVIGGFTSAKYLPKNNEVGLRTFCGTCAFTAPEIVDGNEYYEKVDMWSVGVILYLLLSGKYPFEGKSSYETYELISSALYDFDAKHWRGVSKRARKFVSKLLVADVDKRLSATQALESNWF